MTTLNFDSTAGQPAARITSIHFDYPVGSTAINVEVSYVEIVRTPDGQERELAASSVTHRALIPVSDLAQPVPLHDIKTGAALGADMSKAQMLVAINSLARSLIP